MEDNKKRVEIYMDSGAYNNEEILQNIENAKQEFANKDVEVRIQLNDWGVYVIKMDFKDKHTYINNLKSKFIRNKDNNNKTKEKKLKKEKLEKIYEIRTYGKYKNTQEQYKPY